jgi:CRP-like cAMP-binding protein
MATRDSSRSQTVSAASAESSADSSEFKLQLAFGSRLKRREPSAEGERILRRSAQGPCRARAGMNAPFIANVNLMDLCNVQPAGLGRFLSARVERRNFRAGQQIYPNDKTGPVLFVVERGLVEISLRHDGRRARVKLVGEGAMFGEMRSVGMTMMQSRAVAVRGCSMLALDEGAACELMEKTAGRWVMLIAPKFCDCIADRDRMKFATARARLGALLLELADNKGVINRVTQQELADRLGLARGPLWQALRGLREEGLVQWNRNRVELLDIEGLIRAASVWSGD